jgi:hypothetical protein
MKLERFLTIAGKQYDVASEQIILELNSSGRATFTLIGDSSALKQFDLVTFELNYTRFDSLQRLFVGYVDSVTKVDSKQATVFCREVTGVLSYPLPLSLRHPTLNDVLQAISDKTDGFEFTVADVDYANTKIAHFTNIGSGYNAINSLGRLFNIPDYVWQQQDDGSVFVGAYNDGGFKTIEVDEDLFFDVLGNQSASVIALPTLRAGTMVNDKRVKQLEFSENTMTLTWF